MSSFKVKNFFKAVSPYLTSFEYNLGMMKQVNIRSKNDEAGKHKIKKRPSPLLRKEQQ